MKRYFVTDIHRASDAGAMEKDLVSYAERSYLHIILSEEAIAYIADSIDREQNRILAEKPRRRSVSVTYGVSDYVPGHAYVTIGSSQMNMQLVMGEAL